MKDDNFTGACWKPAVFLTTLALLVALPLRAQINVTTDADGGAGSLRDAVANATNGVIIAFAPALDGQTITLTNGEITITTNLTIDASNLINGITISGNHNSRIFEVNSGITVTFDSLTLTNGAFFGYGGGVLVDARATLIANNSSILGNSAIGGFDGGGMCNVGTSTLNNCTLSGNSGKAGGGIYNDSGGNLTLNSCSISSNSGGYGGGIYNFSAATAMLNNCTLFGNSSTYGIGGGIFYYVGSTLVLNNCTLSGNSSVGSGGGIYSDSGTPAMTNTIVAGNTAPSGADISGVYSGRNNFVGGDPQLAPLGHYGGPTQTMPPLPGSPTIDTGTDSVTNFLSTDQRGYPRASGRAVDIGAVEAQWAPTNSPPVLKALAGDAGAFRFLFTNEPHADFSVLSATNMALPWTNWAALGEAIEISSGQYQFTDTTTTNAPRRFYRVVSP